MDKFNLICDLIVVICGIIPTFISVALLIRNIIRDKNWALVIHVANAAMTSVENYVLRYPDMTSEDKLSMAIAIASESLEAVGITLDEALTRKLVAYITEMCKWAKTVNVTYIEATKDSQDITE